MTTGSVVVTGGAGFIGSNLVRRLVAHGRPVAVVDAMHEGSGANPHNLHGLADQVGIHRADLSRAGEWEGLLAGVRTVFHLAALTGHQDSMRQPLDDLVANVAATLRLLEALRERTPDARIVFTSTRQVYGRPRSLPVSETHPVAPPDVNAVHKVAAEQHLRVYGAVSGLASTVVRLTNTYGPGMRVRDARQTFIGAWLRMAVDDEPVPVFGTGEQIRDLTYVDDVVDALIAAEGLATPEAPTYNIGGERIGLRGLAELIVEEAGAGQVRMEPWPEERRRIDIGDFTADDTAFRSATDWRPRVTLREGIRRSLAYYRAHRAHYWG